MTPTITAAGTVFELNSTDGYQVRVYNPGELNETFIGRYIDFDVQSNQMVFEVQSNRMVFEARRDLKYRVNPDDIVRAQAYRKGAVITPWDTYTPDPVSANDVNEGNSNYNTFKIQPWDIWEEYNLNPWDADLVKRVLRTKQDASMTADEQRILDYKKMIHICNKRIEMLTKGK